MSILKTLKKSENAVIPSVIAVGDHVKELENSGEYSKAKDAMGEWWQGVGVRPNNVDELSAGDKAVILSRIGALSGWLGSMQQLSGSQENAKDLIGEAADLFETINDLQNWADTRSDLAVCYWREGAFGEARAILENVLESDIELLPELRGKILLRSINVEISTCNYNTAMDFIKEATPLVEKYGDTLLLGKLHFHHALILHCQGEEEDKKNLLLNAANNYEQARWYYNQANHNLYAANVETNLGNLFRVLGDFEGSHTHLDKAIHLYVKFGDQSRAASAYDNKARTFISESNLSDAELAASVSVRMLREGGEASVLAESLTTLGIVISRGGNIKRAMRTFDEAKESALVAGDMESASNAVLTQLEELQPHFTQIVFNSLYTEAYDLLKEPYKTSTLRRMLSLTRKQIEIERALKNEGVESWKNFSLAEAVRDYEGKIILKALNESGGRVTKAAKMLGMSHQSLSLILRQRHKDLKQHCVPRKARGTAITKTH